MKFWMHIDKDERERGFNERMEKQWKITDEDWRDEKNGMPMRQLSDEYGHRQPMRPGLLSKAIPNIMPESRVLENNRGSSFPAVILKQ